MMAFLSQRQDNCCEAAAAMLLRVLGDKGALPLSMESGDSAGVKRNVMVTHTFGVVWRGWYDCLHFRRRLSLVFSF